MNHLNDHIRDIRQQYNRDQLKEADLTENPFELFTHWLKMAFDKGIHEPIAMNLATVNASGSPSSRIVLLRGFDENGLIFYSNYNSKKGIQLQEQPKVALNFYWYELFKQIRIEGTATQLPANLSDEYFNSRPRESQVGAWASDQSCELKNRHELDERVAAIERKFKDQPVPRPPYWGGYIVRPHLFEFWQGRPDRLHDRFQYLLQNNIWQISRLAP